MPPVHAACAAEMVTPFGSEAGAAAPDAGAQVVADALRRGLASPGEFAAALTPHAAVYGFRRSDGTSLLQWLLELTGDPCLKAAP